MTQSIRERTLENINRVKNLITIYERIKDDKNDHDADILRAAVVLLHAALEDCLRSLSYLEFPNASPDELHKTGYRVQLGKVAEYRDKTVNELIRDVAFEYLEGATYNNPEGISKALKSLGIAIEKSAISQLDVAIKRRHRIVHRADRGDKEGEVGRITSIQTAHVLKWIEDVERFVGTVFDNYQG